MDIILHNPYRTIGLLVGASLKEQTRQVSRLKQYIEAEQEPPEAFNFPVLGRLDRSVEAVELASSNLNLDADKINYGIFWFYNGNDIIDEPAFEFLKEGKADKAGALWLKIINSREVNIKNASAYFNLSTLMMTGSLSDAGLQDASVEDGIILKLKFLQSDFVKSFKELAADATYQTSKRGIQLLFLEQLSHDAERKKSFSIVKLLNAITKIDFAAKDDFIKHFTQAPIIDIEQQVNKTAKSRIANNAGAIKAGTLLFHNTFDWLTQLRDLLTYSSYQYTSIADKVAGEVLQCGIDYFLFYKETDADPGMLSYELCLKAEKWAYGNAVKNRFKETLDYLREWNNDEPQRANLKLIKDDIAFIDNKLEKFKKPDITTTTILNATGTSTILNAKELVESCKPRLQKIKEILGRSETFYLAISNAVVFNAKDMLVSGVNSLIGKNSIVSPTKSVLQSSLQSALDVTYNLKTFDMHDDNRLHFNKNLDALKSLCIQLGVSPLSPREQLQQELMQAEAKINVIQSQTYFANEINAAKSELSRINEWQFLRSEADKTTQINTQQTKLNELTTKSSREKALQLKNQQSLITNLKTKIFQTEY